MDTEVKTQKWTVEHDADGDFVIFEHTEIVAITNSDTPKDEVRALLISKSPEMADLLRALPLDDFGDDMGQHDAAEFVDHAGQFFEVMVKARALLTTLEKI